MENLRIGIGHDRHRLKSGGPLRLGGVDIPSEHHMVGHSDADVLLHSIIDALLGAAALGDIGEWFPDTEDEHRDRDSSELLAETETRILEAGFKILNLDCIVFVEHPKISPHKSSIQYRVAEILQIDPGQVGIKAKTGEQVGPVGRGECIDAQCVALLLKIPSTP